MFLYPWSKMVGNIFYEHSHRLVASFVGLLTIGLALALWLREPRPWLRRLGLAALALVILQGVLGGLRVVLLEQTLAIVHAATAQLFFALTVCLAVFTSAGWTHGAVETTLNDGGRLRRLGAVTTALVYGQIVFGAVLRHTGERVDAHLTLAALVTLHVIFIIIRVMKDHSTQPGLTRPALMLFALTLAQIVLGTLSYLAKFTALWRLPVDAIVLLTTTHLAVGALMLAAAVTLTLRAHRLLVPLDGATFRMSSTTGTINAATVSASRRAVDFFELTKPRIVLMVLITAFVGYYAGSGRIPDYLQLLQMLLGTALAAGGTLTLNQFIEREIDAKMERTRRRPLPDGRVQPQDALWFGVSLTLLGLGYLAAAVNLLSAVVAAAITLSYLLIYTPMKRASSLCVPVGAIPGALPPVIGWVAARGELSVDAWVLFAIMFLWQIPHTLAIAYLYREDFAKAGIQFLPVIEPDGDSTNRQILIHCAALLVVSLLPTLIGLAGPSYFVVAFLLGAGFLASGVRLVLTPTRTGARRLLFASLIYLPVLLLVMALDRVPI
jgi:protoheme IX farnesyltransferase